MGEAGQGQARRSYSYLAHRAVPRSRISSLSQAVAVALAPEARAAILTTVGARSRSGGAAEGVAEVFLAAEAASMSDLLEGQVRLGEQPLGTGDPDAQQLVLRVATEEALEFPLQGAPRH